MRKISIRILIYVSGLFILAMGIAMTIRTNLGVSPVTSVPSVLSMVSGKSIGTTTFIIYSIYVVLQVIILQKDYKSKDLLQIGFSSIFGLFTDAALYLVRDLSAPNYLGQVLLLVFSLSIMVIGHFLILTSDIVTNAPEGLCVAISKKWDIKFSKVKTGFDIFSVSLTIIISLSIFGNFGGIREGTIIAVLMVGRATGYVMNKYSDKVKKLYT